jgi:hypothetical protein
MDPAGYEDPELEEGERDAIGIEILQKWKLLSKRRDPELLELLSRREMYTFLYPLDARHPDPPQSHLWDLVS